MLPTTVIKIMIIFPQRPSSSLFLHAIIFISLILNILIQTHHKAAATESSDDIVLNALKHKIERLGGYVHPSIKLVSPSPCCSRGVITSDATTIDNNEDGQELWIRVPPTYHLTRDLALQTLTPLIPGDVLDFAPLSTLDDGALLVLLLVHLKGNGSKYWQPYLDSLPNYPTCGWYGDNGETFLEYKHVALDSKRYVSRVSAGMTADYGHYLDNKHWPQEWEESAALAIEWSLCIISSRGTAASPEYGGGLVKLVPLVDMFNHSPRYEGFKELTKEDNEVDTSNVEGSFAVRIEKDYVSGEEIFVDYNLADYSPEEWFMSHGFVPQETSHRHEL